MKKYIVFAALMVVLPMAAQDTYENARLMGNDLNGTARYVGMGGALEALGADISTISTNPAAIGMFRHSSASLSFGAVSQQDASKFDNLNKTNMSFDQVGFVWTNRTNATSYINFAFNYHKSKNFDQLLNAANSLRGASLSKLAFAKSTKLSDTNGGYYLDTNKDAMWMGWRNSQSNERAYPFTQWDYLYTNAFTMDDVNYEYPSNSYAEASDYLFDRAHRGSISEYDFNISGNINNRLYLGLTMGLYNVNYKGYSSYVESIIDMNNNPRGYLELADEHRISGAGVDLKAGIIVRPIEESPFRIGLSVSTPTWFDLTSENYTTIYNNTDKDYYNYGADQLTASEEYDFRYYTPWKFGISVGHTVGTSLALGASYEYTSCGSADTRIVEPSHAYYDEDSRSDKVMNANTENMLKGVSLLKLGVEFKPDPSFAVRFGYNFQSAMYNDNSFRDTQLDSEGNAYASTADYTNWKSTNRITCGLGYKYEKLSLDLSYQYSATGGDFYPFQPNVTFTDPYDGSAGTNVSTASDVNFKRHQLLFTATYTF